MKTFHLIGQNIQTSLSPLIHNFLFQLKGLSPHKYHYSLYPQQNYLLRLEELRSLNISGISVTIPFKQSYSQDILQGRLKKAVISLEQEGRDKKQEKSKSHISAQNILFLRHIINTIKFTASAQPPSFTSFNTDIFGVKMCFRQNPTISSMLKDETLRQKTLAVVIGGGATAEVFLSYFQQLGLKMIVLNRSVEKVLKFKDQFYSNILCVNSFDEEQSQLKELDFLKESSQLNLIVINTLPTQIIKQNLAIESQKETDFLKLFLTQAKLESISYMDVNYRDTEQTLHNIIHSRMQSSSSPTKKILKVSSGLDMLLWQGILQNHIFSQKHIPTNHKLSEIQVNEFQNSFKELTNFLKSQGKVY